MDDAVSAYRFSKLIQFSIIEDAAGVDVFLLRFNLSGLPGLALWRLGFRAGGVQVNVVTKPGKRDASKPR